MKLITAFARPKNAPLLADKHRYQQHILSDTERPIWHRFAATGPVLTTHKPKDDLSEESVMLNTAIAAVNAPPLASTCGGGGRGVKASMVFDI